MRLHSPRGRPRRKTKNKEEINEGRKGRKKGWEEERKIGIDRTHIISIK